MKVKYKDVVGYEGKYMVSSIGEIIKVLGRLNVLKLKKYLTV